MALVLVILAVGSVVAGYVGIPHALGGQNQLAAWLAPSFQPPAGEAGRGLEPSVEEALDPGAAALELTLMGVSSAIAVGGILLASFLWLRRRELAASLARRNASIYTLLLNKYYVDELYDAAIVRPIQRGSEQGLWRGVDVAVVDGAVNGAGTLVAEGSTILRRLQTGSVRAYAGSMFIGVIVILGYYLWR
jgi:NADH-quinone oxidoreductase subunit L